MPEQVDRWPRYSNGSTTEHPTVVIDGHEYRDTRVFRGGERVDGDPTPFKRWAGSMIFQLGGAKK